MNSGKLYLIEKRESGQWFEIEGEPITLLTDGSVKINGNILASNLGALSSKEKLSPEDLEGNIGNGQSGQVLSADGYGNFQWQEGTASFFTSSDTNIFFGDTSEAYTFESSDGSLYLNSGGTGKAVWEVGTGGDLIITLV